MDQNITQIKSKCSHDHGDSNNIRTRLDFRLASLYDDTLLLGFRWLIDRCGICGLIHSIDFNLFVFVESLHTFIACFFSRTHRNPHAPLIVGISRGFSALIMSRPYSAFAVVVAFACIFKPFLIACV